MKLLNLARYAGAFVLVYVALYGIPENIDVVEPSYNGPLMAVHEAAQSMDSNDRQGLSEALLAAGKMLRDDKANLVTNTEELQTFIKGAVAFGYTSFSVNKYPNVSQAVQQELKNTVGPVVTVLLPEVKQQTVDKLEELSKAIK